MKKFWILPLFILWVLAAGQLVQGRASEEDRVVEVFANVGAFDQSSVVEYYGVYKKDFLELDEREMFLKKIALQLGIDDNMTVTRTYGDDREETKLVKEAWKAKSVLRLITSTKEGEEPVQYVIINLSLDSGMQDALSYRKKLDKLMDTYGKNSRSSANIIGSYQGKLSLEERNAITDKLLEDMGAKVVSENRDMQLYTVYAYTPWLGEYVMQEDEAINLNVAMYYSSTKDCTFVYAAVPVLGLDF